MKPLFVLVLLCCSCRALEIKYCVRSHDVKFRKDLKTAMYQWSSQVSGLTFKKVAYAKCDTLFIYNPIYFRGDSALGYCFVPQFGNKKEDAWQIEINPAYWQRRAHPLGVFNRVAVVMHEIGHRIGLQHNDRPFSIMLPIKTFSGAYLDPQDVAEATALVN